MHQSTTPAHPKTLALFCKVIDNFGDIGICWRLARQFSHEHQLEVTLWVDDLVSFQRICPAINPSLEVQLLEKIIIRRWGTQDAVVSTEEVANIVIEFFACDIPPGYIEAMAQCHPKPVWLNLEGLSAEQWVEGCHTLPSPHPTKSLTKYFYFPGFNPKTGGLILETDLLQQRQSFQQDALTKATFLSQLGLSTAEIAALKVSLFCYPHAPVKELFNVWQVSSNAITCLVPEGVATDAMQAFLGQPPFVGAHRTLGSLTVRVIPFLPQSDYDKLVWSCDLNFARGEDSFVRAQWAGRPFIWHIYPQDNDLHHVKLRAFLHIYTAKTDSLMTLFLAWNGAIDWPVNVQSLWQFVQADLEEIANLSTKWQDQLRSNGDLAANLLNFSATIGQK